MNLSAKDRTHRSENVMLLRGPRGPQDTQPDTKIELAVITTPSPLMKLPGISQRIRPLGVIKVWVLFSAPTASMFPVWSTPQSCHVKDIAAA